MAKAKTPTNAAADPAAADQTPLTSASASAALADREGGSEDAASSNGASDQLAAGEGGDALAGGDATTSTSDHVAGPDGASAFAQTVGNTAIRLAESLTALSEGAQSSPSSAPQASGLTSVDLAGAVQSLSPSVQFVGGRFTEVVHAVAGFKVGTSLPVVLHMERDVTVSVDYLAARAAKRLNLDVAGWNALSDDEVASQLSLEGFILDKAIDWPWSSDEDVIEITAVSRDGQPYRRCGYTWTAQDQDVQVHHLVADRLKADPFIVVRAESVAEDEAED